MSNCGVFMAGRLALAHGDAAAFVIELRTQRVTETLTACLAAQYAAWSGMPRVARALPTCTMRPWVPST